MVKVIKPATFSWQAAQRLLTIHDLRSEICRKQAREIIGVRLRGLATNGQVDGIVRDLMKDDDYYWDLEQQEKQTLAASMEYDDILKAQDVYDQLTEGTNDKDR